MGYMLNAANSLADLERQRFLRQQQGQLLQLGQQHVAQNALALGQQQRQEADILGERQALSEGATRPDFNANRTAFEYWKTKDPIIANKIAEQVGNQAKDIAGIDPEGSVDFVNKSLGTNYVYQGLKGQVLHVLDQNSGQTVLINIEPGRGGMPAKATELMRVGGDGGGYYNKLNPEEKAALDAYATEQGLKSGQQLDPIKVREGLLDYKSRVAKISARPDQSVTPFESWSAAFTKEKGRAPTAAEIDAHQRAQSPSFNIAERPMTPYQTAKTVFDMRKEFNASPIVKTYDEIRQQVNRAESAYQQAATSKNFVAIDQAIVNVLNKMIDPNSVVREGEYARTIQNTPLWNRISGKLSQISQGGAGFTDDERNSLMQLIRSFGSDAESLYNDHAEEYRRLAQDSNINPDKVVIKRNPAKPKGGVSAAPVAGVPKIGEVKKGYRFKGGDPSKKENWEKI